MPETTPSEVPGDASLDEGLPDTLPALDIVLESSPPAGLLDPTQLLSVDTITAEGGAVEDSALPQTLETPAELPSQIAEVQFDPETITDSQSTASQPLQPPNEVVDETTASIITAVQSGELAAPVDEQVTLQEAPAPDEQPAPAAQEASPEPQDSAVAQPESASADTLVSNETQPPATEVVVIVAAPLEPSSAVIEQQTSPALNLLPLDETAQPESFAQPSGETAEPAPAPALETSEEPPIEVPDEEPVAAQPAPAEEPAPAPQTPVEEPPAPAPAPAEEPPVPAPVPVEEPPAAPPAPAPAEEPTAPSPVEEPAAEPQPAPEPAPVETPAPAPVEAPAPMQTEPTPETSAPAEEPAAPVPVQETAAPAVVETQPEPAQEPAPEPVQPQIHEGNLPSTPSVEQTPQAPEATAPAVVVPVAFPNEPVASPGTPDPLHPIYGGLTPEQQANVRRLKQSATDEMKAFMFFLEDYLPKAAPGQTLDPEQGARLQSALWNQLRNMLVRYPAENFGRNWTAVLFLFRAFSNHALGERYIHRYAQHWAGSQEDLAAFEGVVTVIQATADPATRTEVAKHQVSLHGLNKRLNNDDAAARLRGFYGA